MTFVVDRPVFGFTVIETLQVPTAIAFTFLPTTLQFLAEALGTLRLATAPFGIEIFASAAILAGDLSRLSISVGAEATVLIGVVATLRAMVTTGSGSE
jgi:hypothetical protein